MVLDFLQIGSNVAATENDPVFQRVKSGEFKRGLCVEANENCVKFLRENYKGFDIVIKNCAITNYNGKTTLYVDNINKNGGTSQHASLSLDFQHKHHHADKEIVKIEVECMTLEALFDKYNILQCERIFIDAEGSDFDILIGTDFDKLNVREIRFENIHLSGPHCKGENYDHLLKKLEMFGFKKVRDEEFDTIVSR